MKYQVITIGHEYGSGGRKIGKLLAKKLGYKYYDSKITAQLAKESGYASEFVKENSEYGDTNTILFGFNNWSSGGITPIDQLYVLQRNLIIKLADQEPCVIVGHCSDYILRKRNDCLNVFIHSDIEVRAKRVTDEYHEDLKNPIKELDKRDKKRKTYYRYYTNGKLNDLSNYHLCIDSSNLSLDDYADIIYDMVMKTK